MDGAGLFSDVRDLRSLSYMWVSATTLLLCDTLQNLPQEITHVRVLTDIVEGGLHLEVKMVSAEGIIRDCEVLGIVLDDGIRPCKAPSSGGSTMSSITVDTILAFRLAALYDGQTKFIYLLAFLLVQLYVGIEISKALSKQAFLAPFGLPLPGCLSFADISSSLPACRIISYDDWEVVLLDYPSKSPEKVPFFSADESCEFGSTVPESLTPLIVSLTSGCMSNYLVQGPLASACFAWMSSFFAIAGSRLIIGLRKAAVSLESNFDTRVLADELALHETRASLSLRQTM
ncbi:hypothetical protein CVT26_005859 [Gymnopilus dilepis]|uniref:Uncharacterized protein n=1 Tax=Gymnopilus dilepis TaxID=231916 RepID=A0A409WFD2_9AGAR|nr:hypothetical protein CVT26_005859 [Gymnopilus dilepis]